MVLLSNDDKNKQSNCRSTQCVGTKNTTDMSKEKHEVSEIIRVVVTPKQKATEKGGYDWSKIKIPNIVITDHSDYSVRDVHERDYEQELVTECSLKVAGEFENYPKDLMPESFVTYVSSCYNLIGQIRQLTERRLSAEIWISQFDKELEDAIAAVEEIKERERKIQQKAEKMKRYYEQRKLDRLRPLLNPLPSNKPSCRSCHDRICILPLVELKRKLIKYKKKLTFFISAQEKKEELENIELATSEAVIYMNAEFKCYLKVMIFKIFFLFYKNHNRKIRL